MTQNPLTISCHFAVWTGPSWVTLRLLQLKKPSRRPLPSVVQPEASWCNWDGPSHVLPGGPPPGTAWCCVSFPRMAVTKHHQLNSLERQNFTLSWAGSYESEVIGSATPGSVPQLPAGPGEPRSGWICSGIAPVSASFVVRPSSLCASVLHLLL